MSTSKKCGSQPVQPALPGRAGVSSPLHSTSWLVTDSRRSKVFLLGQVWGSWSEGASWGTEWREVEMPHRYGKKHPIPSAFPAGVWTWHQGGCSRFGGLQDWG